MATEIISGKLRYAKVLGEPREKYKSTDREWSFELTVDKASKKIFKDYKTKNRFKLVDDFGEVTKFQRDEKRTTADGNVIVNTPYEIFDEYGDAWPQDKLLGNGTEVEVLVLFSPREYEGEKFNKASALKLKVVNHVPYEGGGKDFEFKAKEDAQEATEVWE